MKTKRTKNEGKRAQVNREVPRSRTGYARGANDPALLAALDRVDRRWRTSKPPVTPSLMIRGDRLLLALEVIRSLLSPDGRFPRHRVERALKRFSPHFMEEPRYPLLRMWDSLFRDNAQKSGMSLSELYCLLRDARGLSRASFDVWLIFSYSGGNWYTPGKETCLHDGGFDRFLHAIASGELTEADFKEEVHP